MARELKLAAAERSTSIQAIMQEALGDWLAKPRKAEYSRGRLRTAAGQIFTDAELDGLKARDLSRYIEVVLENASVLPRSMVRNVRQALALLNAPTEPGVPTVFEPAAVSAPPRRGKYDYLQGVPGASGLPPEAVAIQRVQAGDGYGEPPLPAFGAGYGPGKATGGKPVSKSGPVVPKKPETKDSYSDQE